MIRFVCDALKSPSPSPPSHNNAYVKAQDPPYPPFRCKKQGKESTIMAIHKNAIAPAEENCNYPLGPPPIVCQMTVWA